MELNNLETILDGGTPPATTPPAQEPAESSAAPAQEPAEPPKTEDKAAAAFAAMRTQNTQLNNLVKKMVSTLELSEDLVKDPDALMDAVTDKLVKQQAEKMQIPEEFVRKVETQGRLLEQYQKEQKEQMVFRSLESLKNEFNLSQKDLETYFAELGRAQIDPFADNMDLRADYLSRHFTDIINMKVQEALSTDANKAAKATTPNRTQGTLPQGGSDNKVNTVSALERLLSDKK